MVNICCVSKINASHHMLTCQNQSLPPLPIYAIHVVRIQCKSITAGIFSLAIWQEWTSTYPSIWCGQMNYKYSSIVCLLIMFSSLSAHIHLHYLFINPGSLFPLCLLCTQQSQSWSQVRLCCMPDYIVELNYLILMCHNTIHSGSGTTQAGLLLVDLFFTAGYELPQYY